MDGVTDVVVDNTHIEPISKSKFVFCRGQSTPLLMLIFSAARRESFDESVPRWRQKKDEPDFGHRHFDAHCPLNIDFQEHGLAGINRVIYRLSWGAIAMLAVHQSPLE
jgi:hypothetical protein